MSNSRYTEEFRIEAGPRVWLKMTSWRVQVLFLRNFQTVSPARLFEMLVRAYPSFLSHEALSEALWGARHGETEGNSLRTHIYTLRKSLQAGLGNGLVKTIHGRGYSLEVPEKENLNTP